MEEQWWELGACRDANPEVFDGRPHSGGRPRRDGTRTSGHDWSAAKRVCASCPVQPQCLEYVLTLPTSPWDDNAFVAGFTPDEIRKIKRKRGIR